MGTNSTKVDVTLGGGINADPGISNNLLLLEKRGYNLKREGGEGS